MKKKTKMITGSCLLAHAYVRFVFFLKRKCEHVICFSWEREKLIELVSQAVDVRPYNFISQVIISIHYENLKSMLRNYFMKWCGLDRVTHSWTLQGTVCHTAWHCTISNWPRQTNIRKPHSDKCSYTWYLYILIWIHI